VIHLHGGGFVSARPKSHEIYLRKWVRKLRGVPILSIDYSLSPETVFPVALQEILDVYLFVSGMTSMNEEMIQLIGFHPKNIVLMGDSAGSNLSLSLMHVINSINGQVSSMQSINNNDNALQTKLLKIPLPNCLFLPYPYTNPTVNMFTPSRAFIALDPVISIGCLYSITEACHPKKEVDSNDARNNNSNFEIEKRNSNSIAVANDDDKNGRRSLKITNDMLKEVAWFRRTKEEIDDSLSRMLSMNLGPFFHPLKGDFECPEFQEIPMYIQVGEYDPLLDESILLAKLWKGLF